MKNFGKYTAYQMRLAAKACEETNLSMVAAMLRQAADLQEREERITEPNNQAVPSSGRPDLVIIDDIVEAKA